MVQWEVIAAEFRKFHTHPLNVALHLVTTPLAVLGATALAAFYVPLAAILAVHVLWAITLLPTVPAKLWAGSAALQAAIVAAALLTATNGTLSPVSASVLFIIAYFSQDLAHFVTLEPTYQSSYQGKSDGWMLMLLHHTHHLIPLCLDSCWHTNGSLASLFVQRKQMGFTHLTSKNLPDLRKAMEHVGEWALAQKPRDDQTTHWWPSQLPPDAEADFRKVANSSSLMEQLFGKLYPTSSHVVEPLEGMNEVYVACKTHRNGNSDTVFYMDHVDGPYGFFPLVHCYRCMAACTPNEQIETIFRLSGGPASRTHYTLDQGEIMAFDFHRELHRINLVPPERGGKENKNHRVCMKLHYIVYPKALAPLGKLLGRLSTHYNMNFRKLFVSTIDPNSLQARIMAVFVLVGTLVFNSFESVIGWCNVPVLATYALLSALCGSYGVFFYLTSFTHYFVYISTYHQRKDIAFGAFKRDALLFKTLALLQAGIQYLYHFDYAAPDVASLGLLVGGFGLATLAAHRLGVDRTYFGWELGEISGECVLRFPYGVIPHPMILGGCAGWLGFFKLAGFRAAWPAYSLLHVAFYLVHACQEHMTIHSTGKLHAEGKMD